MQMVLEKPSIYLHELQWALAQTTGMLVSEATICRTLKHYGFTQKKMKYAALQRSDLIRAEYQAEIAVYDPSMLVFVDESGSDQRNATRHYGYALRGYSPQSFKFLSRWKEKETICYCCNYHFRATVLWATWRKCGWWYFLPIHSENPLAEPVAIWWTQP